MALFNCSFFSHKINIVTNINVIYPEQALKKSYPTLYLLHGYKGDYSTWERRTNIERYASQYEVAVVMPDVHNSFYCDLYGIETGYKYWSYVSGELITVSRNFFNLSDRREDTFVAGLSMGGFGALKLALNCPDVFCAGASLSGALDMEGVAADPALKSEMEMVVGGINNIRGSENDLFYQARRLDASPLKPRLYQSCGTDDFLYADNLKFKNLMANLSYDYTYDEGPGAHEWEYWDTQIKKVLEWLPLKKIEK